MENIFASNILGEEIKFEFSSPMKNKDSVALQEASISKIIYAKEKQIAFLQTEIIQANIEEQFVIPKIQQKIQTIKRLFEEYVSADIPDTFRDRKQHMIELPYEKDFHEINIPTKMHSIQMNK